MSFIPGYIATLTVGGTDVNIWSSDASLTLNNETLDKTTLGKDARVFIPGLQSADVSISMHLDTAGVALLQTAYASTVPVVFSFRPGALGTADAGQWDGTMIVTSLELAGSVDDNWQMNLSGSATDAVVYTAPL